MENKFLQAMEFRHATKEFNGKKISDEDFNTILEYGRLSPSSFGYEPWRFLVINDQKLREKMKPFTWGMSRNMDNASHLLIILARKNGVKYGSSYVEHIDKDIHKTGDEVANMKKEFYEKFQKDDFDIASSDRVVFDWACKQTYIALANMMTGAAYMGIDSCPVEGFNIQKAQEFIKNELKIDTDEFGVSVMAAFGYRKDEPKRGKTRQELQDIVQWYK